MEPHSNPSDRNGVGDDGGLFPIHGLQNLLHGEELRAGKNPLPPFFLRGPEGLNVFSILD